MSNFGYTKEAAKSTTNIDVVYSSKTVEIEIIGFAVTDRYTVPIVFSDYVAKTVPRKNKVYSDRSVFNNHLSLEKKRFYIKRQIRQIYVAFLCFGL